MWGEVARKLYDLIVELEKRPILWEGLKEGDRLRFGKSVWTVTGVANFGVLLKSGTYQVSLTRSPIKEYPGSLVDSQQRQESIPGGLAAGKPMLRWDAPSH